MAYQALGDDDSGGGGGFTRGRLSVPRKDVVSGLTFSLAGGVPYQMRDRVSLEELSAALRRVEDAFNAST